MLIRIHPEIGEPRDIDLFDYVVERDIPPDEIAVIVSDLHMLGEHIMGGTDMPFVTLERLS